MTTRSSVAPSVAARRFGALADPTRLRIVTLMVQGEWCVCELASAVGLAQPLASYHLRALRRAGFLHVRREGRWHYYALNREQFEGCQAWIRNTLEGIDESAHLGRRCCSTGARPNVPSAHAEAVADVMPLGRRVPTRDPSRARRPDARASTDS